jgi:multidrug resistance efflux pump
MESLPPIPTPPAQWWREFRIQVLPVVVFVVTVAAIIVMWRNYVQPSNVIGQVEAVKANVMSPLDGTLTNLTVEPFQRVTKGQVLGVVEIYDPQVHEAELAAVPANLNLIQARMLMSRSRSAGSFAQLRVELARERLDLALAQTRLVQAGKELKRMQSLHALGVVPQGTALDVRLNSTEYGLDVAVRDHDVLAQEVEIRTNLVAMLETELKEIEQHGEMKLTPDEKAAQDAVQAEMDLIKATQAPFVLKAPMDGVVSAILQRPGERVVRRTPILVISAPTAERIMGYIRQPISMLPTTNDTVVVRTRSLRRQEAIGQILRVGAQFEQINPVMLPDPTRIQMGYPILVSLPPGLNVAPGELVDMAVRHTKR